MKSNWEVKPFEDLYLVPSRNGINRPSAVRGKGYKMINMGEIFAHDRLYDIVMELVLLNDKEKNTYKVNSGDLIFARQSIVAEGAGKCSIVMSASEMTCFESHIIRVRLNQSEAYSLFYYYLFQSDLGKAILSSIRQQGVQAGIRGSDLAKVKVPFPSLPTQQKIAHILSAYDDLIENNLKRIKLLEEMAQITYEEWFVRMKFPEHEQVAIDSETGLPSGWTQKALSEITTYINRGIAPKYVEEEGFVVINQKCIRNKYVNFESARLTSAKKRIDTNKLLRRFDTLINSTGTGTLGRVAQLLIQPDKATIDTHVTIVRANDNISKLYLGRTLETLQPLIESLGKGATNQQELGRTDLASIVKINVPPKDLQLKFDAIASPIYNVVPGLRIQNQRLKEARDLLLPRLMTGMIDVESLSLPKLESLTEKLQAGEDSPIVSEFNVDNLVNDLHNKYA